MCRACSIEAVLCIFSLELVSKHLSQPVRRLQDAVSRDPERLLSTAWGNFGCPDDSRCQGEAALGNWPRG